MWPMTNTGLDAAQALSWRNVWRGVITPSEEPALGDTQGRLPATMRVESGEALRLSDTALSDYTHGWKELPVTAWESANHANTITDYAPTGIQTTPRLDTYSAWAAPIRDAWPRLSDSHPWEVLVRSATQSVTQHGGTILAYPPSWLGQWVDDTWQDFHPTALVSSGSKP